MIIGGRVFLAQPWYGEQLFVVFFKEDFLFDCGVRPFLGKKKGRNCWFNAGNCWEVRDGMEVIKGKKVVQVSVSLSL